RRPPHPGAAGALARDPAAAAQRPRGRARGVRYPGHPPRPADRLAATSRHRGVIAATPRCNQRRRCCPATSHRQRCMRYAIVTETWPPELNGVALTVEALDRGLRERGHEVHLARPRQPADDCARRVRRLELLLPGAPLPRYPGLRFGLPATARLRAAWREFPPHAIYVATEGPLGWSALRAARQLGIPAASGFHTRFDRYMGDYGAAWLAPKAMAWMRRFHNRADATLVPTRDLQAALLRDGFDRVLRLPRAVDTALFSPARRDEALRAGWQVRGTAPVAIHVGRIAAEKTLDLAVRAFRALQLAESGARFVFVGDGPERERLARENPDFVFCGVQRGESL